MKELVENIHRFSENGLFLDEDLLVDACRKLLLHKGWKVVAPVQLNTKIKKLDTLIDYFYNMLKYKHPDSYTVERNKNKDRKIAKLFIESRQKASNINRQQAILECVLIIYTIFTHELTFNFDRIPNFSIFGQDKFDWVTIKAIDIINKGLVEQRRENKEKLMEEYAETMLKKLGNVGYSDKELDAIIENLEG